MITCNLKGGLGNMMFQVAAIKSLAKDNGVLAYFHNAPDMMSYLNSLPPAAGYALEYYKIFKNFDWMENHTRSIMGPCVSVPFKYVQNLQFRDGNCYDGFFQSEKYFAHNRQYVLNLFDFSDAVKQSGEAYLHGISWRDNEPTCAIHVRRGDYLKISHIHPTMDMGYYERAMSKVGPVARYLVFSDDIDWCKRNFLGDNFVFVEGLRDYVDMYLMSMCHNHITCNSSFSWWGAWLSRHDGKKVAPVKWFGTPDIDSSDIIPESWIKI